MGTSGKLHNWAAAGGGGDGDVAAFGENDEKTRRADHDEIL